MYQIQSIIISPLDLHLVIITWSVLYINKTYYHINPSIKSCLIWKICCATLCCSLLHELINMKNTLCQVLIFIFQTSLMKSKFLFQLWNETYC